MPITIKSTELKYKNPTTGQYQGVDAVAEMTTSEQCALIEAKGVETRASIPSDYTTLSDTVNDLSGTLNNINFANATQVSTSGQDLNNYTSGGVWFFLYASNPSNRPSSANRYGFLAVFNGGNADRITQIWIDTEPAKNNVYIRSRNSTYGWCAWNALYNNNAIFKTKNLLLIGDSYNDGNGGTSGRGWGYYFQQFTGCEATIVHQNGGGFAIAGNSNATYPNKTYAQCVSEISGEYDIVIAQSGWNDAGQATESQITTAVSSFVTAARAKWQNAKIYVISTNNGTDTTYTKANKLKAISNAALENNVVSSLYSPYWLIGKNVAATDGIHLNDDGYQLLAHYTVDYVSGWDGVVGSNNYYNVASADRIPPATITVGTNVNCYFNNSLCTISFDVTLTQTESSWVTIVQNLPIPRAYLIQTIGNWNATYQRPIRAEIGNDGILRIRYGEAGSYRILMTYPL